MKKRVAPFLSKNENINSLTDNVSEMVIDSAFTNISNGYVTKIE